MRRKMHICRKNKLLFKVWMKSIKPSSLLLFIWGGEDAFFVGSSPWNVAFSVFEIVPQDFKNPPKKLQFHPKWPSTCGNITNQSVNWSNNDLPDSQAYAKVKFVLFTQLLLVIFPSSFPSGVSTSKRPKERRKRLQTSASALF